jgi:hypothetical protein
MELLKCLNEGCSYQTNDKRLMAKHKIVNHNFTGKNKKRKPDPIGKTFVSKPERKLPVNDKIVKCAGCKKIRLCGPVGKKFYCYGCKTKMGKEKLNEMRGEL